MMDIGTIFALPVTASEAFNAGLSSIGFRLGFLALTFGVLWLFEAAFPLFGFAREHRRGHALRNFALTVIFLLMNLLLSPISPLAVRMAAQAQSGLSYWLGLGPAWQLAVGIVGLDLFAYFAHLTMHRIAWLWNFHRVHHADSEIDVTTAFREHPGETMWRIGWHVAGVFAFGTPMWVLLIYLTLSAFNGQLEHANIRLPARLDRWLRLIFVTPNMHKVHHSRDLPETDMNYANLLSIWDRLGRSYSHGPRFAELHYGLDGFDDPEKQSVGGLLKMPFMNSWGRPARVPKAENTGRRAA
jgi:sterol desaturase/sphingolipid hydroxylase (fatty acid hydroxylase superfamily)